MNTNIAERTNRREFVRDGARAVLCAGMVLMSGILSWRKGSRPNQHQHQDQGSSCPINLPCRNCRKLSGCQEPRAVEFRQGQVEFSRPLNPSEVNQPPGSRT